MTYSVKPLPFDPTKINGLSEKILVSHYENNYGGAVKRLNAIAEQLAGFDYADNNPFHRSAAQVKDGVLCRDTGDPDHFYLIGEWRDIEEHRRIREEVAREIRPEFVGLIEDGRFVPTYAEIVSMTPQEVLDKSQQR